MDVKVDVSASGPAFDGRANRALKNMCTSIRKDVAGEGASRAREYLTTSVETHGNTGRGWTGKAERSVTTTDHSVVMTSGHYQMQVIVDDPVSDIAVTTELASYGPWLEGTGSRNETTRFKGYHAFRMAAQFLEAFAGGIALKSTDKYVPEMNE